MGFEVPLKELFSFIYKAPFDNGLTEHELDHVMLGIYNDAPKINKEEVEDWKWMFPKQIQIDISQNPEQYTEWFKIIFDRFYKYISENEL